MPDNDFTPALDTERRARAQALGHARTLEAKDAELERCYEVINQAEDLLGAAMAHLEGSAGYHNKQVVLDYLRAYFDARKARHAHGQSA